MMRSRPSLRVLAARLLLSLLIVVAGGTHSARSVLAYNGGATRGSAVTLPIAPPGSFTGDSTGITSSPNATQIWRNVTWWTWTPSTTMAIGIRASSIAPGGWDNTLEVWNGTTLVTQNDDSYGLDAQLTFTANAGTTYLIGMGGYNSSSKGTATLRFFEVPSAPSNVTGIPGNGAATVSWTLATASAESVSAYRIYRYINGVQDGTFVTVSGLPPATTRLVTGLTNGIDYTFAVAAVNIVGPSALSSQSAPVMPVGAPGAPTSVTAVAGDAQATVSFAPPGNNGGAAVTAYTVTASPGGQTGTGAASPIVITGLTNGTPYTFTVVATNSAGTGIPSAASAPVTPERPLTPQTITFGALADKHLGDPAFQLTATGGGSGNPVTFGALTSAACSVSGDVVTLVAEGLCTIAANQAGDASFAAAPTVTQTFVIAAPACALSLAGGALPAARVGTPYRATIATGTSAIFQITDGALPQGLTLSSDGTVTGTPADMGSAVFTVREDEGRCNATAEFVVQVDARLWFTTGADAGGTAHVRSFDARPQQVNSAIGSLLAEVPTFAGGARVALGDVNGDGKVDVITGNGAGQPTVRVFNGGDGSLIHTIAAFDASFASGVYVAAGDVNDDGKAEIIVGSGEGQPALVRIFDGTTGLQLAGHAGGFTPFAPGYRGGVRVAAGDLNGDSRADVIVGAGPGGAPDVAAWDLRPASGPVELWTRGAYVAGFAGGIFVAASDINGDGYADVITGAGAGGGPHVRVWDARHDVELFGFFAYDPAFAGGVRVAAADVDGDRVPEIITGAGPGGGPHVRVWSVVNGSAAQELTGFYAYTGEFAGGVFVAGAAPLRRMWIDVAQPDPAQPGVVRIAGWALDEAARQNPGGGAIHVWAYPANGSAPTFAGSTTRGDQRPDVARAFGGSFSRSGFHMDTTALAAGVYDLVVYAMGVNGPLAERAVRVTIR